MKEIKGGGRDLPRRLSFIGVRKRPDRAKLGNSCQDLLLWMSCERRRDAVTHNAGGKEGMEGGDIERRRSLA